MSLKPAIAIGNGFPSFVPSCAWSQSNTSTFTLPSLSTRLLGQFLATTTFFILPDFMPFIISLMPIVASFIFNHYLICPGQASSSSSFPCLQPALPCLCRQALSVRRVCFLLCLPVCPFLRRKMR